MDRNRELVPDNWNLVRVVRVFFFFFWKGVRYLKSRQFLLLFFLLFCFLFFCLLICIAQPSTAKALEL